MTPSTSATAPATWRGAWPRTSTKARCACGAKAVWEREADGHWNLIRFDISKFEQLDDAPIDEVVQLLRDVEGSGWRRLDDPLAEIQRLRHDLDERE